MYIHTLDFDFPESLIATQPVSRSEAGSRVMWVDENGPRELTMPELLECFQTGDVLVVNNTRVVPRRVYDRLGRDIVFVEAIPQRPDQTSQDWLVLLQLNQFARDEMIELAGNRRAQIIANGLPQTLRLSQSIDDEFFFQYGEMPVPPYIRKARANGLSPSDDQAWYQSQWAKFSGSAAAPTASLHFTAEHLQILRQKGVEILELTLHVGLGTFLPIKVKNLSDHVMHGERVEITDNVWQKIRHCQSQGQKVWALGTTVARALESQALGCLPMIEHNHDHDRVHDHEHNHERVFRGRTDLFITPGFKFQVVDRLLTNFHQPRSTLMALVGAFAGLENVLNSYRWAIDRRFRLFSYGDLTAWVGVQQ